MLNDPGSGTIGDPLGPSSLGRSKPPKNGLRRTIQQASFGNTQFRSDAHECALVDTSVWFAAAAKRDARNERAKSILRSIDRHLTTGLVLLVNTTTRVGGVSPPTDPRARSGSRRPPRGAR